MPVKSKLKRVAGKHKSKATVLPCPFCGSRPAGKVLRLGVFEHYEVGCSNTNCLVKVGSYVSLQNALHKWNTRFESL